MNNCVYCGVETDNKCFCTPACREAFANDMYDEGPEDYEPPECPACGGDGWYLGGLGNYEYFRCRHCGHQFALIGYRAKYVVNTGECDD